MRVDVFFYGLRGRQRCWGKREAWGAGGWFSLRRKKLGRFFFFIAIVILRPAINWFGLKDPVDSKRFLMCLMVTSRNFLELSASSGNLDFVFRSFFNMVGGGGLRRGRTRGKVTFSINDTVVCFVGWVGGFVGFVYSMGDAMDLADKKK